MIFFHNNYNNKYYLLLLFSIEGSINDNNKEDMIIDSPDTIIMTRQWKKNLQKQITVFRQIMLDIGEMASVSTLEMTEVKSTIKSILMLCLSSTSRVVVKHPSFLLSSSIFSKPCQFIGQSPAYLV